MAKAKGKSGNAQDGAPRIVNRQARHAYEVIETLEAGLVLTGSEVKSLRNGRANLTEGFGRLDRRTGELWLDNVDIPPYPPAGAKNHTPRRPRKLLVRRDQLKRLAGQTAEKGITLVPLSLYFRDGRAKLELGVARGKRKPDRREEIKKREHERDMRRAMTRKKL